MRQYRIGILGATGAVGREMMKVLEERKFPVSELRLLAGAGSAGKRISFMGKEHTVVQASEDAFEDYLPMAVISNSLTPSGV